MGKFSVEMFGLPYAISGKRKVEFELGDEARLTDIVRGMKKEAPKLIGEVLQPEADFLMEGFAFNINGRFFSDDRDLVLKESDHIILLTMATVG